MAIPISSGTGRGGLAVELGTTNPRRVGSTLYEDFIPQLKGRNAARIYEEMAWNDATVGAILYAVEQLVRQVDWTIESEDDAVTEFLTEALDRLEHSWDDFISAALSMLIYGWSAFEVVYDLDEGKLWWRKFGFRDQASLHEWGMDEKTGDLAYLEQTTRDGSTVEIPAEKLVHFRTSTADGRPEGRSWLRRAYRAWHMKKYTEDRTAIGIERDLNGMPMASVPLSVLLAGDGDDEYDALKKVVTGLKVDELQGIMWPSQRDEHGEKMYELELMSPTGRSKTDSLQFIRAQAMDIASVMLAQFIGLGRDAVGSRALAEPQQELFQTALGALLDAMEEQLHRQATTLLLKLNGFESGRIVHGEIRDIDLDGIGNFVLRVAQAGGDFFGEDGAGMDEFRQMAGLQPLDAVLVEDENVTDEETEETPAPEEEEPEQQPPPPPVEEEET